MEMENSALHGMLDMQTSILEEIKEIRRRDEMRTNMEQMERGATQNLSQSDMDVMSPVGTSMGNDYNLISDTATGIYQNESIQNSLYQGGDHYAPIQETLPDIPDGGLAYGDNPASLLNPFAYSSISEFSNQDALDNLDIKAEIRELTQQQYSGIKETAYSVVEDFAGLDVSRMSSEDISKHYARRSQGVQNLTAEVAGGAVGLGSAAASLMLPLGLGLGVGAVGGYAASGITSGAKNALSYQDILLEDGYRSFNALESTGDMGSIGIGREDRKDLSKSMRHLAVDSFLEDDEMAQILQGSLDFKLLKSAQDAETFENKFKELVETTKKITTTLGSTIEEATAMMGDFNKVGIVGSDVDRVVAFGKVGASFAGEDAETYTRNITDAASSITAGTSISTANVAENIAFGTYALEAVEGVAAESDQHKYDFIRNSGGSEALSVDYERRMSDFLRSDQGTNYLLSTYGEAFQKTEDGRWEFDVGTMNELRDSGQSRQERMSESQSYLRNMGVDDNHMLSQEAGMIMARDTDYKERYQMMDSMVDILRDAMGPDATDMNALTEIGLFGEGETENARVFLDMMNIATDDNSVNQFSSLGVSEQINAAARTNAPGLIKRMKFGARNLFGMPLEDLGQTVADGVGDLSHGINKAISGLSDTERQDLLSDVDLSTEGYEERFSSSRMKERYQTLEDVFEVEGLEYTEPDSATSRYGISSGGRLTSSQISRLERKAETGDLSFEEQHEIQETIDDPDTGFAQKQQLKYIMNFNQGDASRMSPTGLMSGVLSWGASSVDSTSSEGAGGVSTGEIISELQDDLKDELPQLEREINNLVNDNKSLSAEDKGKLWDQMKSAGTDKFDEREISSIAGQGDLYEKMLQMDDAQGRAATLRGLEEEYAGDAMSARVLMEGTGNILGLLQASGVYSEDVFQEAYASDMKSMQSQAKKDMKGIDKLSDAELATLVEEHQEIGRDAIADFSATEINHVVEYLADNVGGFDASELIGDDGRYDSDRVYDEVMKVLQSSSIGDNAARRVLQDGVEGDGGSGSSSNIGDVKGSMDDHKVALEEVMDTMHEEIEILHRAVNSISNTSTKYKTSRMG